MIDADNFEEAVANGDIVLLGIKQICEKLCISRSNFIRIRSIDDPVVPGKMYFPLPGHTDDCYFNIMLGSY